MHKGKAKSEPFWKLKVGEFSKVAKIVISQKPNFVEIILRRQIVENLEIYPMILLL